MPIISVIVPTLNEERFLPVLLESLQKQTFKDFEVIVADAGSNDKTAEIARSYGAKVVPGGMPGPGRNRGAEAASGEFLFFFDADVWIPDNFLENAYREMEDKFIDLATCEFKPQSDLQLDRIIYALGTLTVKLNQTWNPRAAGFCIFITRRLFKRISGFDEAVKIAEDHDLVGRATKFRPLHFLTSTYMTVSVRRLEKEGRFALLEKYAQVELHLLTKGSIKKDIIEYEFGNFSEEEKKQSTRILDEIEQRIIKVEQQYKEVTKTATEWTDRIKEVRNTWNDNLKSIRDSFKSLFKDVKTKD